MAWLVDDINLSTLAFNIANRGAGWTVPARRGDNLTIPGRHGTQWVPYKPFDEGSATLNMWAIGANEDGSMPADADRQQLCRANLDKLSAIFGQTSRLLNVVQVTSNAYGVQNSVTDPSFETDAPVSQYSYQNSIPNPKGRRTASQTLLTNLFPNPEMAAYQTPLWQPRYEGIFPDPYAKYGRTNADIIGTSNYLWPNSFETNTDGSAPDHWSTNTNVAMEVVNTSSTDKAAQPYGGNRQMRITVNSALAAGTQVANRVDAIYFPQGSRPGVSFWYRRSNTSIAGTMTIQVRVLNLDDTDLTTRSNYSAWQSFTVPANTATWTLANYVPSGWTSATSHIGLQIAAVEAWSAGMAVSFDQFNINVVDTFLTNAAQASGSYWANQAGPFFNGDSGWGGLSGDSDRQITRWNANPDTRWIPDAATGSSSAYYTFANRPSTDAGGSSLNFHAMGWSAGQVQGFTIPLQTPTAGKTYGLRFRAKAAAGKPVTARLMKKGTTDAAQVEVATITFTGAATPTADGNQFNGAAVSYEASSFYSAQTGDQLWLRVEVPTRTDGFPSAQFTGIQVSDCNTYFYGDSGNTANSQYAWSGEANNSKSIYSQKRAANFLANGQAAVAADPLAGQTANANTVVARCTADGQDTAIVSDPITIPKSHQGFWVAADLWGDYTNEAHPTAHGAPSATTLVEFLDTSGSVLYSAKSTAVTVPLASTGSPTHRVLRVGPDEVPANAVSLRFTAAMVSPYAGQGLFLLQLLISPANIDPASVGAPDFFDGNTAGAAWSSTANASTSIYRAALPTRWTISPGLAYPGSGIRIRSARSAFSPPQTVATATLRSAHAASDYQVGLEIAPQITDGNGAVVPDGDVQVLVQFLDSTGAPAGTMTAGVVNASTLATGKTFQLQGMVSAFNSFTQAVFWFIASTGSALDVTISAAYLMPTSTYYANPVQRLDFNALYNPHFAVGTKGWSLLSCSAVATPRGSGVAINPSGILSTVPTPVSSSGQAQQIPFAAWARRTAAANVQVAARTGTVRTNLFSDPALTKPGAMTAGGGAALTTDGTWSTDALASSLKVSAGTTTDSAAFPLGTTSTLTDKVPWEVGSTYMVSVSARLTAAQTGSLNAAARTIQVGYVPVQGATVYNLATSNQAPNAAGTTKLSVSFTVPSDARSVFIRLINGAVTGGGDVWFSGLMVEKVTTAQRTNVAKHPYWASSDTAQTNTGSNRWGVYTNAGATYTLGPGSSNGGRTMVRFTNTLPNVWPAETAGSVTPFPATASGGTGSAAPDTTDVHDGAQSIKVTTGTGNAGSVVYFTGASIGTPAQFGWAVGDTIELSAWIKVPTSATLYNGYLIAFGGTAFGAQTLGKVTATRDAWVRITTTQTVSTTTGTVFARLYGGTADGDVLHFDGIRVRKVTNNLRLGIRNNNVPDIAPNLQAGKTYWFAADVQVNQLANYSTASDNVNVSWVQCIMRDDPNNDSNAVTFDASTASLQMVTKGQITRLVWKVTVKASRTITGIYCTMSGASPQEDGAFIETGRWLISEVQSGETAPPDYFDGGTATSDTASYSWSGLPEVSPSWKVISGAYFDGSSADSVYLNTGVERLWLGTPNGSRSVEFTYSQVNALASISQTSYGAPTVGVLAVPSSATHAELVFSGDGGEVSSAYLAPPSGAGVDNTNIDPDLFPYFDGSSAKGIYGEPVVWLAGQADDNISRTDPDYVMGWGTPAAPAALVPQRASTPPVFGWTNTLTCPAPTGYTGASWAQIPRNINLNAPRTYRMGTAVAVGDASFSSGQILVRSQSGAQVLVELCQAVNDTADGTVLWSSGNLPLTGYNAPVVWRDVQVTPGRFVYLRVTYTETKHAAGFRVSLDNLMIMLTATRLGADYPGFFDGDSSGAAWDGTPNASTSSYFGGGRRAYAEVREAIDMSSMAGGSRAEFTVNLVIPGAFWEDLLQSTINLAVSNAQLAGTRFSLDALAKGTAPIEDAVITVKPTGTVTDLVLTDVGTGATLTIAGTLPAAGVVLDCGAFTATSNGVSVIRSVSRTGSNAFLPITPPSSTTPPGLEISAGGSGSLSLTMIARRRYLIA